MNNKRALCLSFLFFILFYINPLFFGEESVISDDFFWIANVVRDHGLSVEETAKAMNCSPERVRELLATEKIPETARWVQGDFIKLLPYPGGRHPRIGFLEGAVDPLRGTKASLFTPWDAHSYIVVDLPEAIFSNLGLLFLAHTHVPTIWEQQKIKIPELDWTRNPDGSMEFARTLPNAVAFGSHIIPRKDGADMELWLKNGTIATLTGLRTQICIMLKGAKGFETQTNDNKRFNQPLAMAQDVSANRYILTVWQNCGRVWGNEKVPCIHSDPVLPDCKPGEKVSLRGRIMFYEGSNVDQMQKQLSLEFSSQTQ